MAAFIRQRSASSTCHRAWCAWALDRWPALAAIAIAAPIFVIAAIGTLYWPGRPFPGFFVMGNSVVPTIGLPDWTGILAHVPFHSRVIAVDGRPVDTGGEVMGHVAALPLGTPVRYTLVKGDRTFTRTAATMPFRGRDYWLTVGLYLVFGFLSIATGLAVYTAQPHGEAAQAFMIQGVVTGLYALTGTALYQPHLWWLSPLHCVFQAFFPAAFIHLGLVFPIPRRFLARRRIWLTLPYGVALVLSFWILATFYASPPRTTALYAAYVFSAAAIAILVALVTTGYLERPSPKTRAQLGLVVPGLALGTAAAFFAFMNHARAGGDFPMNLIAIPSVLFYLSVGYAIAKYDLFDIDALVKQAVTYVTLTVLIGLAYAGALVLLGLLLPPQVARASMAFNIAFVVLVAFVFEPLRALVQREIDRLFFRRRLDYRQTVSEVSAALTSLLDLEEILDRVGRTLTDGLHLQSLHTLLWLDDETQTWRYDTENRQMTAVLPLPCVAIRHHVARVPQGSVGAGGADGEDAEPLPQTVSRATPGALESATSPNGRAETDREASLPNSGSLSKEMEVLGAVLLVPLTRRDRALGCFALGPRRSGQRFTRQDLEILTTLAAQSAVAIENAHSYRTLQALNAELDQKVRARTAALESSNAELAQAYEHLKRAQAKLVQTEKMASLGQLTAGVAHEINNPVSFIVGNVAPLRRHLHTLRRVAVERRDTDLTATVERIGDVIDVIGRGAERTAAIVNDLRNFSRINEEVSKPVDLVEGIEVSLRLLRPVWAGRIEVHRDYASVPEIRAVPGQINQVFMNILANACDAIPASGNIWISTRCNRNEVRVTIRDDGVGILDAHRVRIFDPFFTTKPLGKGTGLGLAISQSIVDQHGGTIEVESESGHGTTFTVVLPTTSTHRGQQPTDGRPPGDRRGGPDA